MMARGLSSILALIPLLAIIAPADAHELRPGYLEITETTPGAYEVVWKAPIRMGRPLAVEPRFPENCSASDKSELRNQRDALISRSSLYCEAPLQGRRIQLAGLDATLTDVLVRLQSVDGSLQAMRATPDEPMVELAEAPTRRSVAGTYFLLGVEHILGGVDHLLFVLALVLLITSVRRLVETITAFTLAHSFTLIGASLGWLSLPIAPVEAVIALSIVFLANEIACKRKGTTRLSQRRPWIVAFAFGLLHGFGFAGALAEIGLPQGEIPMALLTFNLGVEAGQLIFLGGVLLVLAAVSRLRVRDPVDAIASYAIGITASVWLVERIF
ncbi:MAG: HupE/UreJ family protein [Gammaproteobacteria bacterium]|nr:HupE/UreJ family protein [Gammaproteobacteria bacterium]MDH3480178.1 HupE/UreJ family protein [Gammaproteobacteria bacterium]